MDVKRSCQVIQVADKELSSTTIKTQKHDVCAKIAYL